MPESWYQLHMTTSAHRTTNGKVKYPDMKYREEIDSVLYHLNQALSKKEKAIKALKAQE
jgi:hypothetical protein